MTIEFVDELPVVPGNGRLKWEPLIAQLHDQPGRWGVLEAKIATRSAYNAANTLRKKYVGAPYEFRVVSGTVYGRYVGDKS